jgi:hypothetical protein
VQITGFQFPEVADAIIEKYGDGKWHSVEEMAEGVGAPVDQVQETMDAIAANNRYPLHRV